jgi:hypothetical protein
MKCFFKKKYWSSWHYTVNVHAIYMPASFLFGMPILSWYFCQNGLPIQKMECCTWMYDYLLKMWPWYNHDWLSELMDLNWLCMVLVRKKISFVTEQPVLSSLLEPLGMIDGILFICSLNDLFSSGNNVGFVYFSQVVAASANLVLTPSLRAPVRCQSR